MVAEAKTGKTPCAFPVDHRYGSALSVTQFLPVFQNQRPLQFVETLFQSALDHILS